MSSSQPTAAVAEVVADLLVEAGVRRAYTVPGESFLPLLEAFEAHPRLQLVSTRHEGGAAFMAEADGKLTGRPAVVMATRAVGTANLAIGIHTAYQDSTPMVALLGQVETEHLGNEAFQEVDMPAFLREITVSATTVTRTDRVAPTVARALARSVTGRPGPVAVALPSDVLEGETTVQPPLLSAVPRSVAHEDDLAAVARLLSEARQPVVIAGQGSRPRRPAGAGGDVRRRRLLRLPAPGLVPERPRALPRAPDPGDTRPCAGEPAGGRRGAGARRASRRGHDAGIHGAG